MKLTIPKDGWEPIFFEGAEGISDRAKIAGLPKLREVILPQEDLEVRIWGGFGLTPLQGLVLKRSAGQWSAIYLAGIHPGLPKSEYQRILEPPKSGWERCWDKLVEAGLLILPDASELKGRKAMTDGFSYVVELNQNRAYRTYMYANPYWQDTKEDKQIVQIGQILAAEFGLKHFSV